jgi:hypothetical protein
MLNQSELQLADEVYTWLKTVPDDQSLSYYLQVVEKGRKGLMTDISFNLLSRWFWDKRRYYGSFNGGSIEEIFTPSEELTFLSNAGLYSFNSVIDGYGKKYPAIASVQFPADFSNFAKVTCYEWYHIGVLAVSENYIQERSMVRALEKQIMSPDQATELRAAVAAELEKELARRSQGMDFAEPDKEEFQKVLSKFGFIPGTFMESLIQPEQVLERRDLLGHLISALGAFIVPLPEGSTREDLLLEALRADCEEGMLDLVRLWRFSDKDYSAFVNTLAQVFPSVFSEDALKTETSFTMLKQYIAGLSGANYKIFIEQLYGALRTSLDLSAYLYPVNPAYLLDRVRVLEPGIDLDELMNSIMDMVESPAQQALIPAVVKLYYDITQTYPEPE